MIAAAARLTAVSINTPAFERALANSVRELIRDAAREFVHTVTAIVPVWSGQAQATLVPLATAVGYSLIITPDPKAVAKVGSRVGQGISLGDFHLPSVMATREFNFSFNTGLFYFNLNDTREMNEIMQNKLRNETPWHSMQAGMHSFRTYIDENWNSYIPKVSDYLSLRTSTWRGIR